MEMAQSSHESNYNELTKNEKQSENRVNTVESFEKVVSKKIKLTVQDSF